MKYYCITLAETPERTEHARAQAAKAGIELDFIQGIFGKTMCRVLRPSGYNPQWRSSISTMRRASRPRRAQVHFLPARAAPAAPGPSVGAGLMLSVYTHEPIFRQFIGFRVRGSAVNSHKPLQIWKTGFSSSRFCCKRRKPLRIWKPVF